MTQASRDIKSTLSNQVGQSPLRLSVDSAPSWAESYPCPSSSTDRTTIHHSIDRIIISSRTVVKGLFFASRGKKKTVLSLRYRIAYISGLFFGGRGRRRCLSVYLHVGLGSPRRCYASNPSRANNRGRRWVGRFAASYVPASEGSANG